MSEYEKKLDEAAERFQLGVRAMDDDHTWAFKAGSDFGREYQRGIEDELINACVNLINYYGLRGSHSDESIKFCKLVDAYNKSKDVK